MKNIKKVKEELMIEDFFNYLNESSILRSNNIDFIEESDNIILLNKILNELQVTNYLLNKILNKK